VALLQAGSVTTVNLLRMVTVPILCVKQVIFLTQLIRSTAPHTQPVVRALLWVFIIFWWTRWTGVTPWELVRTGGGAP